MAFYHGSSIFQPLQRQMNMVDISVFNGQTHIEEFLDWIAKLEKVFKKMEILENT